MLLDVDEDEDEFLRNTLQKLKIICSFYKMLPVGRRISMIQFSAVFC